RPASRAATSRSEQPRERRHGCAFRRPRERAARGVRARPPGDPPLTTTALRAKEHAMNTATISANAANHPVVSLDDWIAQRRQLLAREKELTRLGDQIARERRALPWVRIEKDYVFDTPEGPRSLGQLFDSRRQLMVQHFMLG